MQLVAIARALSMRARIILMEGGPRVLASFPEVTVTTSQVGRPDDGTDATGFFNTEFFVDLKLKKCQNLN